jgi:hypothetical protein
LLIIARHSTTHRRLCPVVESGGVVRRVFTVSATDLVFLREECPLCFYLKVVHRLGRPERPLPRIFNTIDAAMKQRLPALLGRGTLPAGRVATPPGELRSRRLRAGRVDWVLRGRPDAVVALDGGGYAVVDFKTADDADAELAARYSPQLHAYAWALEQPEPPQAPLGPVRTLGLLVFTPARFSLRGGDRAGLHGGLRWVPVARNDNNFRRLLARAAGTLTGAPPLADPRCRWCRYRGASAGAALSSKIIPASSQKNR